MTENKIKRGEKNRGGSSENFPEDKTVGITVDDRLCPSVFRHPRESWFGTITTVNSDPDPTVETSRPASLR